MAEPSQAPSFTPPIRRRCPDCDREFDDRAVRGTTANCCEACQVKRMTFVISAAAEAIPAPKTERPWFRSRAMWLCLLIASAAVTAGVVWRERLLFQYHQWSQD